MRGVLLEREQVALARLQKKIDDPQEFADAVGAVLPAAFTRAAAQDDRLGQAIAPTVERATQASIQKNPGTMVDILYPVMGPAIRKAIAETLEGSLQSLNQALKHSLSWRGLQVAHRGLAQRQHLRRRGAAAHGRLQRRAPLPGPSQDRACCWRTWPGTMRPRATRSWCRPCSPRSRISCAIRSTNPAAAARSGRSIDSLRLGDLLLWCEEGPSAFLAAVIHGNPPPAVRTHAAARRWAPSTSNGARRSHEFDGDTAPFEEAGERLRPCLMSQTAEPHESATARCSGSSRWRCWRRWASGSAQRIVERQRVDSLCRGAAGAARHRRDRRRTPRRQVAGVRAARPAGRCRRKRCSGRPALDPSRVAGRWEPYQALHPAIMLKRLQATLESAVDGRAFAGRERHSRHRQRLPALDGQGARLHADLACRRADGRPERPQGCAGSRTTFACATPSRRD